MLAEGEFGEIYDLRERNAQGRYVARVKQLHNGRYRIRQATGATRAEARRRLTIAIARASTDIATMEQLFTVWMAAETDRGRIKSKSILNHRDIYRRHVRPQFGARHPASITRAQVNTFLGTFTAISPRPTYDLLRKLFGEALMLGIIDTDPTERSFQFSARKKRPTALTPEVMARLEAAFEAERRYLLTKDKHPDTLLDVFVILRETGCRIGEALALAASAYDPATGVLTIAATMTKTAAIDGQEHRGERNTRQLSPKTEAGNRNLVLAPAEAEPGLYARVILAERKAKALTPAAPLFPSRAGTYLSTSNFRRRWRDALRRNAPDLYPADRASQVHPHLIRHSVATHIVRSAIRQYGYFEGLERARLQLGHSTTKPLLSYVDRSGISVDNSDLMRSLNPARDAATRLLGAVRELAAEFGSEAVEFGRADGVPAFVIYGGRELDAVAAGETRWAGAVVLLTPQSPGVEMSEYEDGEIIAAWAGELDE